MAYFEAKLPSNVRAFYEIKSKSNRSNTMKSSMRDHAEGNMHEAKGKIKEVAGKIVGNHELEAEGKSEKNAGKIQKKVGDVKKIVDK
jgi:uncharacterized protein YjbJ (UPF0337 family)